jgi:hypothetical protein
LSEGPILSEAHSQSVPIQNAPIMWLFLYMSHRKPSTSQKLVQILKVFQRSPKFNRTQNISLHILLTSFFHMLFSPSISSFRAFIMWCDLRRPSQARRIGTAGRLHRAGALQRERGAVRDQRGAARQGAQQQFACAACGDRGIAWVSIHGRY